MGLRTNKVQVPTDETVADNQTTNQPEEEVMTETTTEVALKEINAVAKVAEVKIPSIASLDNAFDPEAYGNIFPRVKGENGMLVTDSFPLGEFIDIQVLSHSERTMVTPIVFKGEPNYQEANKWCRASYSHTDIPGRDGEPAQSIEDYAASIADKYPKGVKTGKYHDIFCLIFNAEKNADQAAEGVFQVSISPTAVKAFKAFAMQQSISIMRGQARASHQNCMRVIADPQKNDSGSYVIMKFANVPLDVLEAYTPVVA